MKELEKQQIKVYQGAAEPVSAVDHIRQCHEYFFRDLWPLMRTPMPGGITAIGFDEAVRKPQIELVAINKLKATTVVKFTDGRLGNVKCDGEAFDTEKGFAVAVVKALGKSKELFEYLSYVNNKYANKVEKDMAIGVAKKLLGKKEYEKAIKIINDMEKANNVVCNFKEGK